MLNHHHIVLKQNCGPTNMSAAGPLFYLLYFRKKYIPCCEHGLLLLVNIVDLGLEKKVLNFSTTLHRKVKINTAYMHHIISMLAFLLLWFHPIKSETTKQFFSVSVNLGPTLVSKQNVTENDNHDLKVIHS